MTELLKVRKSHKAYSVDSLSSLHLAFNNMDDHKLSIKQIPFKEHADLKKDPPTIKHRKAQI